MNFAPRGALGDKMPGPLIPIAVTVGRLVATQLGKKQAAKVGIKTAQNLAKNISTKTPTGKGAVKSVKVQGPAKVTSKAGGRSVTPQAAKVTFKKADLTPGQLKSIKAAIEGKNFKTLQAAENAAIKAATPIIGRAKAKTALKTALVTGGSGFPVVYKAGQENQKKKKKKK
jgi:hypothetical protein